MAGRLAVVEPYWSEDAAYALTPTQVAELHAAALELYRMATSATAAMAADPRLLRRLGIPDHAWPRIIESLERDWSLCGRLDLAWDGRSAPVLLGYRADAPGTLVAAAATQRDWLAVTRPDLAQWNSIPEKLDQAWRRHLLPGDTVHLAAGPDRSFDDLDTLAFLTGSVQAAGGTPIMLDPGSARRLPGSDRMVDGAGREIVRCVSLWPWRQRLAGRAGRAELESAVTWLEPPHSVLSSSAALPVVMWQLFEGHPNLLPAYWEPGPLGGDFVVRPALGGPATVVAGGRAAGRAGVPAARAAADEVGVYQAYRPITPVDGNRPVFGVWLVDGRPAGLGVREARASRPGESRRFVPHYVEAADEEGRARPTGGGDRARASVVHHQRSEKTSG